MNKKFTAFLLASLISYIGYSQDNIAELEEKYTDYFSLNQETIYTQINKSKYLLGEEIWFKTYIFDTKALLPYTRTTNLQASVYDDMGKLIIKKMFYAEDGMANGNFKLNDSLKPGVFYLKTTTDWMKNFNEDRSSVQRFEILGETYDESEYTETLTFDFQILPEGGHLLNNAPNSVGFKVVNSLGKSVIIESGKVLDASGEVITTFKSNQFGIGKFEIFLEDNATYTIVANTQNGTVIKHEIPRGENIGLALMVNNLNSSILFVNINTNESTLPNILGKQHYLLLHRDGLFKKITINFEANKRQYLIPIPKEELPRGITIMTLVNEDNVPILERLIFNNSNKLTEDIILKSRTKTQDSTIINLKANGGNAFQKSISISVLPSSTEAYNTNENIITTFLLSPYLKGAIENASYYFTNNDRKTIYDLDLLLLSQGWSKYSWNHIFHKPQIAKYPFGFGFKIDGKINNKNLKDKSYEVVLFSSKNRLLLNTKIDDQQRFNFENVFIEDSTSIHFTIKDAKGKLFQPKIYSNISPKYTVDSLDTKTLNTALNYRLKLSENNINLIYNNAVTLDTVSILSEKIYKPKNNILTGTFGGKYVDLKNNYSEASRILDVIRDNGFDVIVSGTDISIYSRRISTFQGRISPNVYLNNARINDFLDQISYLTVNDIEELYVSKTPSGVNGVGGNINIFTKKFITGPTKNRTEFNSLNLDFGFSYPKNYYTPLYNPTNPELFSKYGVLNWIPNLSSEENNQFTFKIANYNYDNINLYIEGMTEDGRLISEVIPVEMQ